MEKIGMGDIGINQLTGWVVFFPDNYRVWDGQQWGEQLTALYNSICPGARGAGYVYFDSASQRCYWWNQQKWLSLTDFCSLFHGQRVY
jgi:hypothetical protein